MSDQRLKRLRTYMQQYKIQAVAINAGSDLKYLTDLDFHLSERPVILIIGLEGDPAFIFPEFEKGKIKDSKISLKAFPYQEDPKTWSGIVSEALQYLKLSGTSIGVSPSSMRFLEIDLLQRASGQIQFISAGEAFRDLYIQKDEQEIQAIRKAVEIAQNALINTIPIIIEGKTEKEIMNQLVINLLNEGCDPELPFKPIVAAGPNSANPHANPGDRKLQAGDLVVIDWGARFDGYVSDITRSFAVKFVPEPFVKIAHSVLRANQTAREKVAAGLKAKEIDACARKVIEEAGYSEFFLHRTGHGIGLNPHEDPYISQTSQTALAAGMVFTIEPGIYLSGVGGVRIEDNVVVTPKGAETLTSLPRELLIL